METRGGRVWERANCETPEDEWAMAAARCKYNYIGLCWFHVFSMGFRGRIWFHTIINCLVVMPSLTDSARCDINGNTGEEERESEQTAGRPRRSGQCLHRGASTTSGVLSLIGLRTEEGYSSLTLNMQLRSLGVVIQMSKTSSESDEREVSKSKDLIWAYWSRNVFHTITHLKTKIGTLGQWWSPEMLLNFNCKVPKLCLKHV